MKSGLEDRNNISSSTRPYGRSTSLNEVRSGRPEQRLASEGGPDKELYQPLRALRLAGLRNNTLLSCQEVKHLVKPLRALPGGDDTTTDPSPSNLPGTPKHNDTRPGRTTPAPSSPRRCHTEDEKKSLLITPGGLFTGGASTSETPSRSALEDGCE